MQSVVASHRIERDELLKRPSVPRQGLSDAVQSLSGQLIKVVVGPRRAGKSVFALQMLSAACGSNFAYVNFDDERLMPPVNLDELLKAMIQIYGDTKTLFFDEIQNAEHWELFVTRLQRAGYNIVLSGSNAHLLSGELSTHLTGRYREFRLLPFSFSEYLAAKSFVIDERLAAKERQGLLLKHLDDFLMGGGFPEVVAGGADRVTYLTTLFDSILFKDVVKRHNIRHVARLSELSRWLVANVARNYTCTSLKNSLAFRSVHTVENYIGHLIEAFLFMSVIRYSPKARLRVSAPRKIYSLDTGMANAVRFRTGRDTGRLMENLVAVELCRRGIEFYSFASRNGSEVDFLLRTAGADDQLFQVCYDLSDSETRRREFHSLAAACGELHHAGGTVLTWDEEGTERVAGFSITLMPLWKWLLGES